MSSLDLSFSHLAFIQPEPGSERGTEREMLRSSRWGNSAILGPTHYLFLSGNTAKVAQAVPLTQLIPLGPYCKANLPSRGRGTRLRAQCASRPVHVDVIQENVRPLKRNVRWPWDSHHREQTNIKMVQAVREGHKRCQLLKARREEAVLIQHGRGWSNLQLYFTNTSFLLPLNFILGYFRVC